MNTKLLVPGTSGCKLILNGNEDIGWPVGLTIKSWLAGNQFFSQVSDPEELVSLLSMEYGNNSDSQESWIPTKTTLHEGELGPGPVIMAPYNQFSDFQKWEYDWRSDIRRSGQLLLEFLKKNKPEGKRWQLVGHSQGGLVIIVASKLCAAENGDDDTAFSKLVSHVALAACPVYGTINALDAIVNAQNLAPNFKSYFRRIAVTWPALYQMLPYWHGVVEGEEAPDYLLQSSSWEGTDYGIDPNMLHRALVTRREFFNSPISRMRDVEIGFFMSRTNHTWENAKREGSEWALIPKEKGDAPGEGDTLVPYKKTVEMMGYLEEDRVYAFGEPFSEEIQVHFMICVSPTVSTAILKFLDQ